MRQSAIGVCFVLVAIVVGACTTSSSQTSEASAEEAYFDDIESYARDLGGFESKVASRADMLEFADTACEIMDAGGTPFDMVYEVSLSYDATASDQPYDLEDTVLLTIYAITSAADNFCPEHREAVNDFLTGDD